MSAARFRVTFLPSEKSGFVDRGATIFDAALDAGVEINSVCGGQKQCAKCKVIVRDGAVRRGATVMLDSREIAEGYVAACDTFVESDLTVVVPIETIQGEGKILRGEKAQAELEPPPPVPVDISDAEPGLAVDIGTTTIVAYLVDTKSGATLDIEAKYNSQMKYGEDYIKRIIHLEQNDAAEEMQRLLVEDLNELTAKLCARNGLDAGAVKRAVIAGNTAMHHFLLRLDPGGIRREPFEPVTNFPLPRTAAALGLKIDPAAKVDILPGVSVYVGADIVAGVLAVGLLKKPGLSLFVDVGTNGEIVLSGGEWAVCCSASAGPSFEGGGVKHGMRATEGAIEDVAISLDGAVRFATVGDTKPKGICGSGLIDCLAEMFRVGILERNGRLAGDAIRNDEDGTAEFLLVPASQSATGRDIVINQIDVTDLLRSKAAVFAAVAILCESVGVALRDIERIFIAGGFGNYLNIENAVRIGLLPDVERGRYHFVGNTAIAGARRCLLSPEALAEAAEIARSMTYIDLMRNNQYMDYYQQAMFLPHTNLDLFPSIK